MWILVASLMTFPQARAQEVARSLTDRADQVHTSQIHFVYVVPKGSVDQHRDIDLTINSWVVQGQSWLQNKIGHQLSIDTFNDQVDVTFLQSGFTSAQLCRASSCNALGKLAVELHQQDPKLSASKVIIFNLSEAIDKNTCGWAIPRSNLGLSFSSDLGCNYPGSKIEMGIQFQSFAILHEVFHALGVSYSCGNGSDLMVDFPECNNYAKIYGHVITSIDSSGKNYIGGDASGVDLLQIPMWLDGTGSSEYLQLKPLVGDRLVTKLESGAFKLKVGAKTGRIDWIWSKRIDNTFRENLCVLSSDGRSLTFHGAAKLVGTFA
jgi:hypothetical protein